MARILDDPRAPAVDPRLSALLTLLEKITLAGATAGEADFAAVKAAGWSDEAIYDAITVCALFNFYNTWVDGCGVPALPDYTLSGKRLASEGYIQAEKPA